MSFDTGGLPAAQTSAHPAATPDDGPTAPVDETPGTTTAVLSNGLTCEIPRSSPLAKLLKSQRTWVGPSARERHAILRRAKSVAIVGGSPNATQFGYVVGTYLLQWRDYRVCYVSPNADTILGQKAYPELAVLPEVPDIVDVF